MEHSHPPITDALTFDDVLLVPQHSSISPPEVKLHTKLSPTISLNMPFISAAMDKVTESETAVGMAQHGGAGVIHKNLSIEKQALEVAKVKKSESGMILDPITLEPDQRVSDAFVLMEKHKISGFPVVSQGVLVGIVTNRDLRFEEDKSKKISQTMTPRDRLVVAPDTIEMEEAVRVLHKNRIEKLPIVNGKDELKALITLRDIQKTLTYPNANRDEKGQLRVGAAVGVLGNNKQRVEALVEAGVDFIVVDTAHGDSKNVIEMVGWVKKTFPHLTTIGGNVATAQGTENLFKAGADAVKVGIGCGSICTTRIVAGIGVPQFSAILDCAKVAKKYNRFIIADGGVKYSGDAVKALAAGAHVVMVGGLLAGTDEAPGETIFYQGRTYKSYRGMGSIEAMASGSRDRYGQMDVDTGSLVPEGIEGMVPYRGSMNAVLTQLCGGVQAGLGYVGCENIEALHERAQFVRITTAGLKESHVHDVFVTKEAPNYRPTQP